MAMFLASVLVLGLYVGFNGLKSFGWKKRVR